MDIRSHLVFEIGTLNTRAGYFEEVGSHLRFINIAVESSTHLSPENNALTGVEKAIKALETKIGKPLLREGAVIAPEDVNGAGADHCEGSYSFGSAISTLIVDLGRKNNTEAIRSIAGRNNMRIADGVNDKDIFNLAFMLNVLQESEIELILVWVDGTSDQKKIEKLVELCQISTDVFGPDKAPYLLMIGDPRKLRQNSKELPRELENSAFFVPLRSAEDQADEIDHSIELITKRSIQRLNPSMMDVEQWINKELDHSDRYVERFIQLLARSLPMSKNILGIDLGASSILITGRVNGAFVHEKFDQLGVGAQFAKALSIVKMGTLMKRGVFISEDKVRNYIYARSLNPEYIPDQPEELSIHYEVARAMLRAAFEKFYAKYFPTKTKNRSELSIERIYLSGEIFTNAPKFHYLARLLLEGTKLPSAAEIYLDRFNIISMIGKLTWNAPELFDRLELKDCVTPICYAVPIHSTELEGTPVLKLRITTEGGEVVSAEIPKGDLFRLDLPQSGDVKLSFYPVGHTDAGSGKGIPREERLSGDVKTLLIDTRERPIELPSKLDERKNMITRWQIALGESL